MKMGFFVHFVTEVSMTDNRYRFQPLDPEIVALANQHGGQPEVVLEIFQAIQERRGGLTHETIEDVARTLHIPAEKAYGVASFYSMLSLNVAPSRVIRECNGPVCWLKRATDSHRSIERETSLASFRVERTSCLGLCDRAPAILFDDEQAGPVSPADPPRLLNGWRGTPTDYSQPRPGELRLMMALAGKIDPDSLQSALEQGAYSGLKKAMTLSSEDVVSEVESSGLTGRGGAGFLVGRKWRFVAQAAQTPRYVICNADESEPLIFKDRVLIDTNPHQILEGMAIAGYATGSNEAFIYIRGEYAAQAGRLENAIRQAEDAGFLGEHVLGSGFSFHVHVHKGAGAYICGEETALIESLEGKRGEPRPRPPYPPSYGYLGMPTLVNNVESYAAVPAILRNGMAWYRAVGNTTGEARLGITPGTKIYMILGHIRQPGLFEAPFGITLRQAIEEFGGGMLPGSQFAFALTGGAAGTIVPSDLLDVPIDYASASKGISLGAGAFLICDQSISVVAFLHELLRFFTFESCGKCTPCRIGTTQSLHVLERLANGDGRSGDVQQLKELADVMQIASFCGLGQSVAIPMKSALANFSELFLAAEKAH
jgi:NADH:ubiquinone oxidoreductase subunit F (NADH-binding)/NADH:ubiquinone oxidoreductase subunit E